MEQVKGLVRQTLQRIHSQENYQSYLRRDDPIRNKVAEVIVTLGLNYGHLFTSHHCKNNEMLEAIITIWARDIGSYSSEKLDRAIERCKAKYIETVNLPQFMTCLHVSSEQALLQRKFDKKQLPKYETPEKKRLIRDAGLFNLNAMNKNISFR